MLKKYNNLRLSSQSVRLINNIVTNQARVQEFVRGGAQNLKPLFFLLFNFPGGGGPAQKIAEKMIFSTKKSSKI